MFKFLKSLFNSTPTFGTGSLPLPADSRRLSITQVQAPVTLPDFYITDISMLEIVNQGNRPSCVGHSIAKLAEYYIYKIKGKIVKFDGETLYEQCKKEDGIPHEPGTYATVAAKIVIRDGIDQEKIDSNDKFTTGYAFVPVDFLSVAQAIYQNGVVTIGLFIDTNWFKGIIGKCLQYIGGHQTDLHGFDLKNEKIYGINSWGIYWIGQIAGFLDSKVKPGTYVAKFDDIKNDVINIISFLPVSKEIIEDIKNTNYRFITTMKYGMKSCEIQKLQERLSVIPASGYFGNLTKSAVMNFQKEKGLYPDGIVGPQTRSFLNVNTKSFIPQWAEAITIIEKAKKELNNPGNIKCNSIMHKDAIGKDYRGICKFPSPEIGNKALETMLMNAASGKSSRYPSWLTLLEFYAGVKINGVDYGGYAPASDKNEPNKYASFVAKRLGVTTATKISELL